MSPSSQPGLTLPEFLLAMFLAKSAVGGHQPPQVLPDRIAAEVRAAIASISAPRASPSPQPPIQTLHRPQSIPSPSPATSWSIPLAQQAQFDSAYSSFDPNRTGHLPRSVALSAFAQSGLRMEIIEKIWDMVDVWGSGRIDKKGFSAGLMLVNRVVQGKLATRAVGVDGKRKNDLAEGNVSNCESRRICREILPHQPICFRESLPVGQFGRLSCWNS